MAIFEGPGVRQWSFSFLLDPGSSQGSSELSCIPSPSNVLIPCLLSCWCTGHPPMWVSLRLKLCESGWLWVVLRASCCRCLATSVPHPWMGSIVSGCRRLLWGESDHGVTLGDMCLFVPAITITWPEFPSPGGGEHISLTGTQ